MRSFAERVEQERSKAFESDCQPVENGSQSRKSGTRSRKISALKFQVARKSYFLEAALINRLWQSRHR